MIHWKKITAILILVSISLIVVELSGSINSPENSSPPPITVTRSTCDRQAGFILIIASLSGFNDSIDHGAPAQPWPIVHVQKGQIARFVVCNHDATQPHGFAISYYFDSGIAMAPGDAYQVVFEATRTGTFSIFCNIFCTVHVFMRGQLVVSN